MNSLGLEIAKIAGAIVGIIAAALVAYWKFKDKRQAKDLGIDENPKRCGQHEEAIDTLKKEMGRFCDENREDHRQIFAQVGAMSIEIAKLGRNGGGGK
jgi:hypothetical protein